MNYRSAERFSKDYALLQKGKIFLPSKTLLPLNTALTLNFTVPDIDNVFTVQTVVVKAIDQQIAAQIQKPTGMLLAVVGGPNLILKELRVKLGAHRNYQDLLGLAEPSHSKPPAQDKDAAAEQPSFENSVAPVDATVSTAKAEPDSDQVNDDLTDLDAISLESEGEAELTLDWLRNATAQQEVQRDDTLKPEITIAPSTEKQNLTLEERKRAKPSAEFLMDLTKAMLRSGYYAGDHPGSKSAKQGLYEKFQNCLDQSREIMITKQESREKVDILITGILDEPVNIRTLVGVSMAELFVPKLREYFKRKGLVTFAIKNDITLEHFESFVDIMSDPTADTGQGAKVGELLSKALADHGITEISTVFLDDLIMLELNLPWRVEMAIQRLAKDLKMLPMFQTESDERIRTLKLQIIQDIIRPLRHPQFLKDLIINCYIIAKHVTSIQQEDIEQVIIEAFPLNTLLPTSEFIFKELKSLRERHAEDLDSPVLVRRVEGVKRILKWVVRRLIMEDVSGAQSFLEQLYLNEVLKFDELPPDVQYLVNTIKMARDVQAHVPAYVYRILHAETSDDAVVLLKFCRRVLSALFENKDWKIVLLLTKAVDRAGRENAAFSKERNLSPNPQKFMFKHLNKELADAYENAEESDRKAIDEIVGLLGVQGIEILGKVLSECDDRGARKSATDALIQQGESARQWILKALENPEQPWFLLRNALMILRFVDKGQKGIDRARSYVTHAHPRVRDEALHTLLTLKGDNTEQIVINALDDSDDKVLWRATNALVELAPLSDPSDAKLSEMIKSEIPEEKQAAAKHALKVSNIIRALGAMVNIKNIRVIEEAVIECGQLISGQKKGIFQRLKKSSSPHQTSILSAVIATLGKIGTTHSEAFLEKLAGTKTSQAEAARTALDSIRVRYTKQQTGTPANA
ncbi:MAG: hypothetical protein P8X68_02285 [Desulfobacterales bacterium]